MKFVIFGRIGALTSMENVGTEVAPKYVLTLYSDVMYSVAPHAVHHIRIPLGHTVDIASVTISGAPAQINLEFCNDVTATSPVWVPVSQFALVSGALGDVAESRLMKYDSPVKLHGYTGNEGFRLAVASDVTPESAAATFVAMQISFAGE